MLGFGIYKGLENISYVSPKVEPVIESDVRAKDDDILDIIFSIDPRTGLPCGSISQFLSDKTNPQVREYIAQNVLVDLPDNAFSAPELAASKVTREVGDDFLIYCLRRGDETIEDYESRVSSFLDSQRKARETERNLRKLNNRNASS